MSATEKLAISLPKDLIEKLRRAKDEGRIDSVSGYIAELLRREDDWRDARATLDRIFARCPGPELAPFQALASGNAPRTVLGRRRFTITLRPGGGFADDGYGVTLHGQVSLTFARGRPVSRVQREPLP